MMIVFVRKFATMSVGYEQLCVYEPGYQINRKWRQRISNDWIRICETYIIRSFINGLVLRNKNKLRLRVCS